MGVGAARRDGGVVQESVAELGWVLGSLGRTLRKLVNMQSAAGSRGEVAPRYLAP